MSMAICLLHAYCAKAATKRAVYIPAASAYLRPTHKMRWSPKCMIWPRMLAASCPKLNFDLGRGCRSCSIAAADRLDDLRHKLINLLWRAADKVLRIQSGRDINFFKSRIILQAHE